MLYTRASTPPQPDELPLADAWRIRRYIAGVEHLDPSALTSELGQEMYERLATMGGHFAKLGNRLDKAVEAFNDTVGSLERRVLPAARRASPEDPDGLSQ